VTGGEEGPQRTLTVKVLRSPDQIHQRVGFSVAAVGERSLQRYLRWTLSLGGRTATGRNVSK
jgi:hypothetical protein